MLSVADEMFTENVSSEWAIVENYLRRLLGLWCLLWSKQRWKLALYNVFLIFYGPN